MRLQPSPGPQSGALIPLTTISFNSQIATTSAKVLSFWPSLSFSPGSKIDFNQAVNENTTRFLKLFLFTSIATEVTYKQHMRITPY